MAEQEVGDSLIDLSHLTDSEKSTILEVVNKDIAFCKESLWYDL